MNKILQNLHYTARAAATILSLIAMLCICPQTSCGKDDTPRPLTVVGCAHAGHFCKLNENGTPEGLLVDFWKLWSQKTGIPVHVQLTDWEQARRMVYSGEADVLFPAFKNPRLLDSFDFSSPLYSFPAYIFAAKDLSGVHDMGDLKGLRVGVVKDSIFGPLVTREAPFGTTVINYPDSEALIKAAILGEIHAFIDLMPIAKRYLVTLGAQDDFVYSPSPVGSFTVHAAVKKGNREILQQINSGLSQIGSREREELLSQWEGSRILGIPVSWKTLALGLGALGILLAAAFVCSWHMRRKVGKATQRLIAANEILHKEILEREKAEEELLKREKHQEQFFMSSPMGIAMQNAKGELIAVNPAFERIFGFSTEDIRTGNALKVIIPEISSDESERQQADLLQGKRIDQEGLRRRSDGFLINVHICGFPIVINNEVQGYYRIYQDITSRKNAERQLMHQAFHDSLTGLPNRTLFMDRLEHAMTRHQRNCQKPFAVLFLDLDRFKVINDSLGHEAGDKLILQISERLAICTRKSDTLARIGGDEFAVLLEDLQDISMAEQVAQRILAQVSAPMVIDEHELHTSASIGIVVGTDDRLQPENVLRDADIAMYNAKDAGRGVYRFFDKSMRLQATETMQLENDLRRAIERNEFELHYQPIININTGQVSSLEALIRWNHPERGMVYPDGFLQLAEETGLIIPMSMITVRTAMRQLSQWQSKGLTPADMSVSINLSASQFLQPQLPDAIEHAAREFNIQPSSIHVEITESAMLQCTEMAKRIINDLRRMGTSIVMDDFGTGYSSLSYLHQFPVDKLKIDRSFIMGMEDDDPESCEIAKTIVLLGHNLGMEVVAEGVEMEHHMNTLRQMNCDYAQGYLIAKPLPASKVDSFLASCPVQQPATQTTAWAS
ncbi:MAG: EAL domain-containing protein [Desulfovibrio sp.]|uniref:EAL domain-containing protein n=1 Tax=Desulfovibrio sp. 7SRBS1 TaxID=3378064 RepID=UPI003B422388